METIFLLFLSYLTNLNTGQNEMYKKVKQDNKT